VLMWEISTSCGSTSDMVSIQFDAIPTTAMAGNDIEVYTEELTVQLSGNTPQTGSGLWTVISGDGGVFSDATNPQTEFTGSPCESYALGWTISTACYENTDEINVIFDAVPSLANAGGDIVIFDENNVLTLNAQSPEVGSGLWSIVSGAGGIFADPYNPATTFTAAPCETYNLRWTVATECDENFDEISVSFDNSLAIVNAGADITICENNAPVLQGTAQNYQALLWETSGTGAFSNPEILNPAYIPGDEDKENGVYDSIVIKIKNEDELDAVMEKIENKLMLLRHVTSKTKDFSLTSSKQMQATRTEMMSSMNTFLVAIAAVSLIVGAVGIANTMFTSVLEKTKEIGIMKAIGARNKDIMSIFLLNAGLIGLVGGFLGSVFGIILSGALPALMGDTSMLRGGTFVSLNSILIALSVSVIIGIVSGMIPAYQASKLKPVDALRYE